MQGPNQLIVSVVGKMIARL